MQPRMQGDAHGQFGRPSARFPEPTAYLATFVLPFCRHPDWVSRQNPVPSNNGSSHQKTPLTNLIASPTKGRASAPANPNELRFNAIPQGRAPPAPGDRSLFGYGSISDERSRHGSPRRAGSHPRCPSNDGAGSVPLSGWPGRTRRARVACCGRLRVLTLSPYHSPGPRRT